MVVQDYLNFDVYRIFRVQRREEFDEFGAPVPRPDQPDDFARLQGDPGQEAKRTHLASHGILATGN